MIAATARPRGYVDMPSVQKSISMYVQPSAPLVHTLKLSTPPCAAAKRPRDRPRARHRHETTFRVAFQFESQLSPVPMSITLSLPPPLHLFIIHTLIGC